MPQLFDASYLKICTVLLFKNSKVLTINKVFVVKFFIDIFCRMFKKGLRMCCLKVIAVVSSMHSVNESCF